MPYLTKAIQNIFFMELTLADWCLVNLAGVVNRDPSGQSINFSLKSTVSPRSGILATRVHSGLVGPDFGQVMAEIVEKNLKKRNISLNCSLLSEPTCATCASLAYEQRDERLVMKRSYNCDITKSRHVEVQVSKKPYHRYFKSSVREHACELCSKSTITLSTLNVFDSGSRLYPSKHLVTQ